MFQEIWKWDDAEKRVKFDREHSPQAWQDSSDGGVARVVTGTIVDPSDLRVVEMEREVARWRRLYESKSIECARLQKRVEELEGRG